MGQADLILRHAENRQAQAPTVTDPREGRRAL
jgi:hypothetical protein